MVHKLFLVVQQLFPHPGSQTRSWLLAINHAAPLRHACIYGYMKHIISQWELKLIMYPRWLKSMIHDQFYVAEPMNRTYSCGEY